MKYQILSLKQFLPAKGAIYYVAIATVIFSRVKIPCFRAKAHLVFHRCLYNKVSFRTKTVLIDHGTAAQKKVTRQKVVVLALHLGNFSKDSPSP